MTRGPRIGLVLPGGGARAAYQAGVLKGIAEVLPESRGNPFPIISGTSAGAINATVIASNASNFTEGVARLNEVWANFSVGQVYRSDVFSITKTSLHWLATLMLGGLGKRNPTSLLNNAPLRQLLASQVEFASISRAIEAGDLDAVAVTASGYSSAQAVTFFQDNGQRAVWQRARREGRREDIGLDHLMASIAVPFVFPPVRMHTQYFGDGAIRESNPLSAAVHLGADRLLVIGVRDEESGGKERQVATGPPSFGQIAGYMLDTIFLDGLYADLERLTRINQLVEQVPEGTRLNIPGRPLKRIDTHIIVPSEDIRDMAARHAREFPWPVKGLLRGVGALNRDGTQLLSYLLFEAAFTRELIALGYADCMRCRDTLVPFLQGEPVSMLEAPRHLISKLSGTS